MFNDPLLFALSAKEEYVLTQGAYKGEKIVAPLNFGFLTTEFDRLNALNACFAVVHTKWMGHDETPVKMVEVFRSPCTAKDGGDTHFSLYFYGFRREFVLADKQLLRSHTPSMLISKIHYDALCKSMNYHEDGTHFIGALVVEIKSNFYIKPADPTHSRKRLLRSDETEKVDGDGDGDDDSPTKERPSIRQCLNTVIENRSMLGMIADYFLGLTTVDAILGAATDVSSGEPAPHHRET